MGNLRDPVNVGLALGSKKTDSLEWALTQSQKRGILFVSYAGYPGPFGLSKRIQGLQSEMSRSNIYSEVLSPHSRTPRGNDRSLDLGLNFSANLLQSAIGRAIALSLFSLAAIPAVISHSRRKNLLIQYESLFSAFPAVVAKRLLGEEVVGDEVILMSEGTSAPIRYLLHALDCALIRMTDYVTTSSVRTLSWVRKWFPDKPSILVLNGVTSVSAERASRIHRRELVFVGSLSAPENRVAVENTLRLAESLSKKGLIFQIYIVGGPARFARQYLKHEAVKNGKVIFLGILTDKRLSALYRRVSIGLLPFFSPSYGGQRTKGLEYLTHNLLVVSGPYGLGHLPGAIKGVHYLQAENLDDMTELIARCISDPESYLPIAAAGREFVESTYCWQSVTGPYLDLIQKLLRLPSVR
jgi:glycosyltransferase involved in cell wall biosynthesis